MKATMSSKETSFVVIGRWDDASSSQLALQDFMTGGRSTIPIFSDEDSFRQQTADTPFEREGVVIDAGLLRSMLKDGDLVILDAGRVEARQMTKGEFDAHVDEAGEAPTARGTATIPHGR